MWCPDVFDWFFASKIFEHLKVVVQYITKNSPILADFIKKFADWLETNFKQFVETMLKQKIE